MIQGIGIDSVDIARMNKWYLFSPKQLQKVFHQQEIEYCLKEPIKSAERFAARFAAKEAFYKATCAAFSLKKPFSTVARCASIVRLHSGLPYLEVDWRTIGLDPTLYSSFISLTHTKTVSTAIVIIQSNQIILKKVDKDQNIFSL